MTRNFFKKFFSICGLLVFFNLVIFAALPAPVLATTTPMTAEQRCAKFKNQFNIPSTGTNLVNDLPVYCSASGVIIVVINYGLGISGAIAVLFLIVGGFWYITSAGNEEQSEKGKKTIINAVIGLIVIILSSVIIRIIASTLSTTK